MEEWRDIPGFEGIYEASNMGRIRTIEGKTTVSVRHGIRHWKQRILKQKMYPNKRGRIDARVSLYKGKVQHTVLVSRIIAITWCSGYSDGLTVNHKDGNPLNNRAENLEWVTLKENIQHGYMNGLFPQKRCTLVNESGESHVFVSQSAASRFLGRQSGYIHCAIKRGRAVYSLDKTKYCIQ